MTLTKTMSLIPKIKENPRIKKLALYLLMPRDDYRPRLWVRTFLNPFRHKRGAGSTVRFRTRLDVFPYNQFCLGKKSLVEDFSTINNAVGDVVIGDNTIIGLSNVIIGPVSIGSNVMLAQNVVVSGLNHGYEDVSLPPSVQKVSCKIITIDDDVWIGANVVVTAGVHIGRHSVVGAGSIVTKDIPEFCVAFGNPARVVKRYNQASGIWEKIR
jgi:acetyltransferase-like isoleucine patch superfamily enzyme